MATMALLNKEIDFLQYVPFKDVERFRSDYVKKGIVIDEIPGQSWYEIFFGCQSPITKEVKFRQACAYAIDREFVTQAATRGYAARNPSFIDVQNAYYSPVHKGWPKKDLKKAKQLLKEANYNGEEVEIVTTKKYAMMYNIGIAVQSELAEAGIKSKLTVVEWANLLNLLYKGGYQIITFGISPRPDPVSCYIYLKYNGFDDQFPKMKQIREEAQGTVDFQTRKKLFEDAHRLTVRGSSRDRFLQLQLFPRLLETPQRLQDVEHQFPAFLGGLAGEMRPRREESWGDFEVSGGMGKIRNRSYNDTEPASARMRANFWERIQERETWTPNQRHLRPTLFGTSSMNTTEPAGSTSGWRLAFLRNPTAISISATPNPCASISASPPSTAGPATCAWTTRTPPGRPRSTWIRSSGMSGGWASTGRTACSMPPTTMNSSTSTPSS